MEETVKISLNLYNKLKYCINNKYIKESVDSNVTIEDYRVIIKKKDLYDLLFNICNNIDILIGIGINNNNNLEEIEDKYNIYLDKYSEIRFKNIDIINGKTKKMANDVFAKELLNDMDELNDFISCCYNLVTLFNEYYKIMELFSYKKEFIKNISSVTCSDTVKKYRERYNNAIENKDIEEIKNILKEGEKIINNSWKSFITDINKYDGTGPFRFLCHSTKSTKFNGEFYTKYISSSLITNELLDTYREGFGFILDASNIVGADSKDLNSVNNAENTEALLINNDYKLVKSPIRVLKETIEKKEALKGEDVRYLVYNEVVEEGFNPIGIFCITDGSKRLNNNYVNAKKLSLVFPNLKFIEIDESLYKSEEELFYVKKRLIERMLGRKITAVTVLNYQVFWNNFMKLKENDKYSEKDIIKLFDDNNKLLNNVNFDRLFTDYKEEEIKYIIYYNSSTRLIDILNGEYDLLNLYSLYNSLYKHKDNPKLSEIVPGIKDFLEVFPNILADDDTIKELETKHSLEEINKVLTLKKHL